MARARTYKRDSRGRFASTGSSGKVTGGTLAARSSLKRSRAKAAANNSPQQRGAVTRGSRRLAAQKQAARIQVAGSKGRLKRPTSSGQPPAKPRGGDRGARARAIKAMASRRGTVAGRNFQDGQARQTMSLREMRSAVIRAVKGSGRLGMADIAMAAGTGSGVGKITSGRMPRTRGEWEKAYRSMVSTPQSDRGRRSRPGVVNGVDIHKNFRPWAVFKLDPKTATRDDVRRAFRAASKQAHPDAGGRRKDFERLQEMRDSLLAFMPPPKSGGKRSRRKATTKAATRPNGPRMLPASRG